MNKFWRKSSMHAPFSQGRVQTQLTKIIRVWLYDVLIIYCVVLFYNSKVYFYAPKDFLHLWDSECHLYILKVNDATQILND
jgi:hypothetical protein